MLKDFRIRHCNCLEHVLCNIILNEYTNEGLLFINSWKFRYLKNKPCLRDKFSIYLDDYSDLYSTAFEFYGISIKETIDMEKIEKSTIIEFLKKNRYVALKIKACECPWLSFLHEIHGNHMILVMDFDENGVFCSDNSAQKYFLPYDFVITYVKQIVVFAIEPRIHNPKVLQNKIESDLSTKVSNMSEFESIKLFADEFESFSTIDDELMMCELITSPLIKRLSLAGFSRVNYGKAIKYVYEGENAIVSKLNALFPVMMKLHKNGY